MTTDWSVLGGPQHVPRWPVREDPARLFEQLPFSTPFEEGRIGKAAAELAVILENAPPIFDSELGCRFGIAAGIGPSSLMVEWPF
jgi:hypothetical protein